MRNMLCVVALAGLIGLPVAVADWTENFDSYPLGTVLFGVGGWSGWYGVESVAGQVSGAHSHSFPYSIEVDGGADDAVHPFTGYTSGQWVFTAWQYIPSNLDGLTYFILNNEYSESGSADWAVETHMDPASDLVWDQLRDPTQQYAQPVVYDAWIEIRVDIDLDANFMVHYYNGAEISSGTWNIYTGGDIAIANVDLYAPHDVPVWYDDISLLPVPGFDPGDLNCDGAINAFDIDPFVLALTDPAGYAVQYPDCDVMLADINDDEAVDAFDIDPFIDLLTGG